MIDNYVSGLYGTIKRDFDNLSNQNGRRALIYLLGNNSNAIVAADILIYFIYLTLEIYKTPEKRTSLEQYDGFIVCPYQQIEIYTGCSNLRKHKTPLNLLLEEGLIEIHNKAYKNKSCFKVNVDTLNEKLEEAYDAIDKERKEYWDNYHIEQKKREEQREVNVTSKKKDIDWSRLNEYLEQNPDTGIPVGYDFLLSKGFNAFQIHMMYFVNRYWKDFYRTDYEWNEGEFNTLSLYLISRGSNKLNDDELERLKDAIGSLDEVDWMTKAHIAKKIVKRFNGYGSFDK